MLFSIYSLLLARPMGFPGLRLRLGLLFLAAEVKEAILGIAINEGGAGFVGHVYASRVGGLLTRRPRGPPWLGFGCHDDGKNDLYSCIAASMVYSE